MDKLAGNGKTKADMADAFGCNSSCEDIVCKLLWSSGTVVLNTYQNCAILFVCRLRNVC